MKLVLNSEALLVWLVSTVASSTFVFLIQDMYIVQLLQHIFSYFVMQFEEVFKEKDKEEALRKIIDPRLGDNYPFDSVYKVIFLLRFLNSFFIRFNHSEHS